MRPVETSTWSVRYTLPKDDAKDRRWAVNKSVTVVCGTLERAGELVRNLEPDAVIYSVNHKGREATLLDAAVVGDAVVNAAYDDGFGDGTKAANEAQWHPLYEKAQEIREWACDEAMSRGERDARYPWFPDLMHILDSLDALCTPHPTNNDSAKGE